MAQLKMSLKEASARIVLERGVYAELTLEVIELGLNQCFGLEDQNKSFQMELSSRKCGKNEHIQASKRRDKGHTRT